MSRFNVARSRAENRILAALPPNEYSRIRGLLEGVQLEQHHVVVEARQPIEHVYFPEAGIVSIVVSMADGALVEAGQVGREGLVGVAVALGATTMSGQAVVLISHRAQRVTAGAFTEAVDECEVLRRLVLRYTQALMSQIAQSAACNRLHETEARLCRWLLMCQDRTQSAELSVTHESIAQALGVRRSSVTVALGVLQTAGLIHHSRGKVVLAGRESLMTVACECYGVVRAEYDRVLPPAA